ncbi:hypothetical protein HDU86_008549 [Geranomyces michiganensis]|nr:hypothetical protein HDU86_008549 [Geranomyces michiganensis]
MPESLDAQFNEYLANSSRRVESDLELARRAPHYSAGETTARPTLTKMFQATSESGFGRYIPATAPGLHMDDIKSADVDQLLAKFEAQEAASTTAPSLTTTGPHDEAAQQKKKKKKNKPKKKRSSSLKQATSPSPTPTAASVPAPRMKDKDEPAKIEQPAAGPTPRSPIAAALAAEPISTPALRRNSSSRTQEDVKTAVPLLAHTDLPTDTYQVLVSPIIPPCLYAAMLEEMASGGFVIQALHRRSDLFAHQGSSWLAFKEWRDHPSACLSFSFAVHLSKKPTHSSLTTAACAHMLTLWAQKMQKSELLRGSEWDVIRKTPSADFFHVTKDSKTRNQNLLAESSERKLPFLESAENRLSRVQSHEPQFYDDELPQVGFMAARSAFAPPLMKKILESGSGFELLGIKYLKDISPARARYLTPYEVGDVAWTSSLDHISSTFEGQGWFLLVVRKAQALEDMHKIVDEYLESYLRISAHNDTPEIGRRRRSIHTKAEPVVEETMESLRLQVIVSPNIDSSYAQTTIFFRDAELVPRGLPDVKERSRHPPWFLYDPLVTRTMTENPPLLFTVCVLKQAAFPMIGDVLAEIRAAEFEISSAKCTHVNQALARRMFRNDDINKPPADVLERFITEMSEGPVIIFALQRENAISKWMKILEVLRAKSSVPTKSGSLFEGGIYASTTWSAAGSIRNALFPEGATTKVRYIRDNHKIHKILQQTDMVTSLPAISRALVYTRRREEVVVTPPPSPTAAEMNPPELVCVTLLPAHRTTEDTYASWGRVINAILLEPDKTKQPSPVPPDQTERGKLGPKRRKRRHGKGAKSPDRAVTERITPEPASDTKAPPPPARVVACRYIVLGPDAIDEWSKWCPQVTDSKRLKSQVAQGACLALAVETDDAARIATAVAGLPASDRRCVAFTKTCEEACGQLPIMFGELFDSFYKIVTERPQ